MPGSVPNSPLAVVVDELLMLVQETTAYHQDRDIQAILQGASRMLLAVRRNLQLAARRYVVGMVGLTNVGKSTLLNALLGNELTPRRNRPCTAVPIEFTYGEAYCITACCHRQHHRPTWHCTTAQGVHEQLTALADDFMARTNGMSIRKLIVEAPHPLLAEGLIIADTPGFGAAQAADAEVLHEEVLHCYLRDEVSKVFWVVLADQGITQREKSFHDQYFAEVCDDVVVTGCEDWDSQDRERYRHRFASCFPQRMPTFHFVSGVKGVEARGANDEVGLMQAGIKLLENRIRELATPDGRNHATHGALQRLADDLNYWLLDSRARSGNVRRSVWRPGSWDRWLASAADHAFAQELTERLKIES